MPTPWTEQYPKCFHKTDETSTCEILPPESAPHNILGQHAGDDTIQGGVGRQLTQITLLLESLGFVINKLKSQLLPDSTLASWWTPGK